MATQSNYQVYNHRLVESDDLPKLPNQLKDDFKSKMYHRLLASNPHNPRRVPSHSLRGKLKHCRSLEIKWAGDRNAYRLVYRICEKPAPRRVEILSFALHDPAYDNAKSRLSRNKSKKK